MTEPRSNPEKDRVVDALSGGGSAFEKYQTFFVGRPGIVAFLKYELAMWLAAPVPGALGFALRKTLFPALFGQTGRGLNFGRNLVAALPGTDAAGGSCHDR